MIEFQDVTIRNFLSYGDDEQTIPLADQGLVLVEGLNKDEPGSDSNRAGKSVIGEALVWCLTDHTIRGVRYSDIVNRFIKKNCMVKVKFKVNDSLYSVARYYKHKKYQNKLRLFCDGRPLHSRHKDVTQKLLEDIVGMDFQAIVNSVVFGGTTPFALKSDADQKKILESFLRFGQFDIALKRTKSRIAKAEEERQSLLIKVEKYKGDIKGIRDSVAAVRGAERISRRAKEKKIRELEKEYRWHVAQKPVFKKPIRGSDLKSYEEILSKADWELETINDEIAISREGIEKYEHNLKRRKKFVGKDCPFCGSIISEKSLADVEKHFQREMADLQTKVSRLKSKKKDLERRIAYGRKSLKRLEEKRNSQIDSLTKWETICARMVGRVQAEKASLESSLPTIDIDKFVSRLAKKLSVLTSLEKHLHTLNSFLEKLHFWEMGFGNKGIKSQILQEILPELNEKVKELADEIFQNTVQIEFVPTKQTKKGEERELFHIKYEAKRGSASYLGESSGGRRRIDICILLCFAWLARASNVLFVDELLDALDESGREIVLHHLSLLRGTVMVITHRQDVRMGVGQVWTIVKENGFSRVEM
jgi:chromosome segregation ATPase